MHALDNPIWESLTTLRSNFAEGSESARRFPPDMTSMAGFPEPSKEAFESLAEVMADGKTSALFLPEALEPPAGWQIVALTPLLQMTLGSLRSISPASDVSELTAADAPEMLALARLTQPGPFGIRTVEMGNYIGVRRDGKIVAMAGERLRVEGHAEISAVCTHPDYLGRGFAAGLIGTLVERIRSRGENSFLHVRGNNDRAIELYKRLGFETRVELQALVLRRAQS
jgi:ribosomal protein S18 acetylase RimI-like enzyme